MIVSEALFDFEEELFEGDCKLGKRDKEEGKEDKQDIRLFVMLVLAKPESESVVVEVVTSNELEDDEDPDEWFFNAFID